MKLSKVLIFAHFCPKLLYMGLVVLAKDLDKVVDIEEDDSPVIYKYAGFFQDRAEP